MANKQLPNSPRRFRSLADLPPEPGLEESPLLEIPGAKELKRGALGALKEAGVPEVAVEAADILIPESPEGVSSSVKKAGKAISRLGSDDFKRAQKGHQDVKDMLRRSMPAPEPKAAPGGTLDYSKMNPPKDPSKRVPRSEVDSMGRYHTLELSEGLTQDRMESLEKLKQRNPARYQEVIKKWREKGILQEVE